MITVKLFFIISIIALIPVPFCIVYIQRNWIDELCAFPITYIALFLLWLLGMPLFGKFPCEIPDKEMEIINVHKTDTNITFQIKDWSEKTYTKTEAKFVNTDFKVYKVHAKSLAGMEWEGIEYRFEDEALNEKQSSQE